MNPAEIRTSTEGTRAVIVVRGEIDLANRDAFGHEINGVISNQTTVVHIDLSEVGYIDSAGLRVLFTLATRLDRLQIELELVAPEGSPARRVLDLSGLTSLVKVLPGP